MASALSLVPAIFAGVVAGSLAVLAIVVVCGRAAASVRLVAALCSVCVAAYAIASLPEIGMALAQTPLLGLAVSCLVSGAIGFYALTARAIFEDEPIGVVAVWPPAALVALWLAALAAGGVLRTLLIALFMGLAAALLIYVAWLALRGRAGDLVESRRRLRWPVVAFTVLVCLAALADIALSTATRTGLVAGWMTLERETGLAALSVATASMLMGLRTQYANMPDQVTAGDPDEVVYAGIRRLMDEEQAWREEGVSLAVLSATLNAPEYRVRRVIITRFGARNFPAFVNGYRVEAAKARLAGDEAKRPTIAETAFDVGFGSLTAFNRAFKEIVGEPPTSWRRRMHAP